MLNMYCTEKSDKFKLKLDKNDYNNELMIGSYGTGKMIVVFTLSEQQYAKFKNYCTANNNEYTLPYGKNTNHIIICCEKSIFSKFRMKFFYLFLKPFAF